MSSLLAESFGVITFRSCSRLRKLVKNPSHRFLSKFCNNVCIGGHVGEVNGYVK